MKLPIYDLKPLEKHNRYSVLLRSYFHKKCYLKPNNESFKAFVLQNNKLIFNLKTNLAKLPLFEDPLVA